MICPRCGHTNLPGDDACSRCLFDLTALDRPAPQDRVESSLMNDPVRVLAPKPPVSVDAAAPVAEAVRRMAESDIGAVLVTDGGGRLVGIFTERDVLTKVAATAASTGRPVGEFMTPQPESVTADDPLALALHKMDLGGYRHLPVVRDGRPEGVISVRDVIRHITRLCREQ